MQARKTVVVCLALLLLVLPFGDPIGLSQAAPSPTVTPTPTSSVSTMTPVAPTPTAHISTMTPVAPTPTSRVSTMTPVAPTATARTSTMTPVAPTKTTVPATAGAPTMTPVAPTKTTSPATTTTTPVTIPTPSGAPISSNVYHFSGSLVPSAGAQVSHVDGILTLRVAANGTLSGSLLRLNTGGTIPIGGSGAHGLVLSFDVLGLHLRGQSTAVGPNRISGLFMTPSGGTNGFWVATRVAQGQMGTRYRFSSRINRGPDRGTTYDGSLQLYGDTYGGLLGFLTVRDGALLRVDGQSVNGNINMLVVVRAGTPLFASGTTSLGGAFQGTIAGPLAGDQGTWTATK